MLRSVPSSGECRGLFALIVGNPSHVDPRLTTQRPDRHGELATVLELFLVSVVTKLKDGGFDVAAPIEEFPRQLRCVTPAISGGDLMVFSPVMQTLTAIGKKKCRFFRSCFCLDMTGKLYSR